MSRIHLTIDRLVLGGMDAAARQTFVDGLRAELARALADPVAREAGARDRRTPVLRLGRMALAAGPAGARRLGAQVARGIYSGLAP